MERRSFAHDPLTDVSTVPDIVAALGAPKPDVICDAGYDDLFIVTVPPSGTASVVKLRYGAPAHCVE